MGAQRFSARGDRAVVGTFIEELELERDAIGRGFQRVWDNVFRGQALFVDPVTGNDLSTGQSWDTAVKTINRALAIAVSGRCDRIYCAPGTYLENVLVTKDSITLIGFFPGGQDRP